MCIVYYNFNLKSADEMNLYYIVLLGIIKYSTAQFCIRRYVGGRWITKGECGNSKSVADIARGVKSQVNQDVEKTYIGRSATYESSRIACKERGKRLCRSREVCVNGIPLFGVMDGDFWVAVGGRYNEWTQIGNSPHSPCINHGDKFGPPAWGTRTNGKDYTQLGYVFCCPL